MSSKIKRHKVDPDPVYHSTLLARFINVVMKDGKKTKASHIVYGALDIVKERTNKDGLDAFKEALSNVRPIVEIKSRRIGGATYQIPVTVEDRRSEALAFRWLIGAARAKKGRSMAEKMGAELMDAVNKTGSAMERREATHRMAEANKAFAHFG